jgi:ankyrin repeat protein
LRLIEAGIDINGVSVDGWRPIHVAAQEGHLDCVRVLAERDADVNVQDEVRRKENNGSGRERGGRGGCQTCCSRVSVHDH